MIFPEGRRILPIGQPSEQTPPVSGISSCMGDDGWFCKVFESHMGGVVQLRESDDGGDVSFFYSP